MDGASYLMDRPPGGWSDLVTNETLRLELRALTAELRSEIDGVHADVHAEIGALRIELHQEFRSQTWRMMTATFSVMAILVAAMGMFVSLAKL